MSDILVVGGGVIGLLTARELLHAGATVTLIEMGETGRESSWAGGGILSPLYPWRLGDALCALSRWSQAAYPALCERLHAETGIDPEHLRTGMLILDPEEGPQALRWAERHGVSIETLSAEGLRGMEPELGPQPIGALWMPDIAHVRNPRLAKALHRSIEQQAVIREHEEVVELLVEQGRVVGVRTRKGTLHADRVVVCAGAWTAELLTRMGERPDIHPVRGQMILFLAKPGTIHHVVLYRDHYAIPRADGHLLAGSTLEYTGFVKDTTAEAKEELYRSAVELFPLLRHTPIEDHWAGLRPGSPSGIPYIGPYPGVEGLYLNAGHFRNGLVTGPASARLAVDLMLGREPVVDPGPYGLHAPR